MAHPAGEANDGVHRLDFDRRLMLQFRGSVVTSDAGLLAYREMDDALGLTVMASDVLADARTGKNGRHRLAGLLRQSVFGRLAGYEDVNDAERLSRDPAMRRVVGDGAITGSAASASQMGRFETKWLSRGRLPRDPPGRARRGSGRYWRRPAVRVRRSRRRHSAADQRQGRPLESIGPSSAKAHIRGDRIVGKNRARQPHRPAAPFAEGVLDEPGYWERIPAGRRKGSRLRSTAVCCRHYSARGGQCC
jgi:hypothetical protein